MPEKKPLIYRIATRSKIHRLLETSKAVYIVDDMRRNGKPTVAYTLSMPEAVAHRDRYTEHQERLGIDCAMVIRRFEGGKVYRLTWTQTGADPSAMESWSETWEEEGIYWMDAII